MSRSRFRSRTIHSLRTPRIAWTPPFGVTVPGELPYRFQVLCTCPGYDISGFIAHWTIPTDGRPRNSSCSHIFRAELQPSRFKYRGEFCQKASGDLNSAIDIIFVGRMHPNLWMTFGGMGSKKLSGLNIEYIAKNDTHPGAHFNSEFRS